MRVFWIVVGVLAVAAAVIVFATGGHDGSSTNGSQPAPANLGKQDHLSIAGTDSRGETSGAPTAIAQESNPQASAGINASTEPDATALVDDLLESSDDPTSGRSIDKALDDGANGNALQQATAASAAFDPSHPVDGKYIVAGSGTTDDPFEISWDLLLLASQTYQPRYGKADIPPQVQAIDGKHIKIAGYFAFPLASTDARELLFMLNMWDGCCIGVPPSPYDAIEVRLSQPMAGGGGKQWVNYGTLSGTIKVDPYVHEGWLLGMYLMEDGTVDVGM